MTSENGFEGQVAVVTGRSSGIGLAVARRLRTLGASVMVTARRRDVSSGAAEVGAEAVHADVTDAGTAAGVVASVVDRHGRIDHLVNNADGFARGSVADTDPQALVDLYAVKVFGPTYMTQAALEPLRANGGAVVNVPSIFGHKAAPGAARYAAGKAAVESLTRSWALELAGDGIRVNVVAPGPTDTAILETAGFSEQEGEAHAKWMTDLVPLHRTGRPDEIADWVVYLLGAARVTGEVITVDGELALA